MLEDLFIAYYGARKHKRSSINQLRFELDYESNLIKLRDDLLSGKYEISKSICFIIFDPIQREIMAADFRDRVVHHLVFNYINPILEKQFITDSYSCRKGKGTHYGVNRMKHFLKECSKNYTSDCYILKLDIKGYFMSINKNILWEKLNLMLSKELPNANLPVSPELLMKWLKQIVFHNSTDDCIFKSKKSAWNNLPPDKSLFNSKQDCGLPIGNLTSQLFSNVYLHNLDVFVKNELNFQYIWLIV